MRKSWIMIGAMLACGWLWAVEWKDAVVTCDGVTVGADGGWELYGVNREGKTVLEFPSGVHLTAIGLETLGNGHLFLQEIEVSADGKNWRPLLGRWINLPSVPGWEEIALPPSAIGKFWRFSWRTGTQSDAAAPVGVRSIVLTGAVNRPERHLLGWTADLADYREHLDFLTEEMGVTDLWLGSVVSASVQSQLNQGFDELERSGALAALRERGVRYWLNEHETVNQMMSLELLRDDLGWKTFQRQVEMIYPKLRDLGFSGVVFDAEDYNPLAPEIRERYEKELNFSDHANSWGFLEEFGRDGAYYRRGNDFGRLFHALWPEGVFIQLYEARLYAGKPGCRDGNYWWLQGIADAGVEIWIATEKTYGAGQGEISGSSDHLHRWFADLNTFLPEAYAAFPMATRIIPGFHPWNTRLQQPMYRPEYLAEQLELTQKLAPAGWIYLEGNPKMGDPRLTLDRALCQKFGVTPEEYLAVFRQYPTGTEAAR